MSEFHEHSTDSASDAFESLLREAQWPEPDEQALKRLGARWRGLRRARPRRAMAAVAASLALLALGGWLWLAWTKETPHPGVAHPNPPPRPLPSRKSPGPAPPIAPKAATDGDPPRRPRPLMASITHGPSDFSARSRPPNAYEVLAFLSRSRRPAPKTLAPRRAWPELEAALSRLTTDPAVDAAAICQPLASQRVRAEEALLRLIYSQDGPRRVAAVRMLRYLGSRRSVESLLELRRAPATRAAANDALAWLADPLTLARLVREETDPVAGRTLLAGLIRNDPQATALFLNFVHSPHSSSAALAALADAPHPPVALLFGALNSPLQSQRTAAAVALGQIDDPRVAARLIEMALQNHRRQEALVALLASSSRDASRFLHRAQDDQTLVACVWAARFQLQQAVSPQYP